MHPAYSVIFFTSSSGAGYGALIWLAVFAITGAVVPDTVSGLAVFAVALGLVTAGLLSSTFHLGHPERAWRAISQWRTSWLSREGVAALATYIPVLLFALGWILFESHDGGWRIAAVVSALAAAVTVGCTGMIYASLRAIPRWTDATVVPVYLAFALASGGALAFAILAFFTPMSSVWALAVAAVIAAAWALKFLYWRRIDNAAPVATAESATGLGHIGKVRLFEAPHTGENYIMREMGYRVARKHAARLRLIAALVGGAVPAICFLACAALNGVLVPLLAAIGFAALATGVLVERWLFFAEAEHASMLYYGRSAV
ncbi:MAG: dimethyl sulfoxide reductase anchor subunit [Alphaproteobacteria bacterium]|nr:dimethyl sulfoxide reductase anchor subunit [Alphaproteobacteria bacterium]